MFNLKLYENSRPDGIPVLEVVPDAGPDKKPPDGQPRLFVPLKRTELFGEVAGPLADLRLVQVYGYTRAQSDKTLEAAYRFPMPGDAAVTAVRVRFGDVEIDAELKEREQAEAEYAEAKKQGQQAALATRESPDVFTLRVAGLQPDQDVTVETSYVQLARAQGAGWTLRLPLTTSPRYVRSDEVTSRHAHGQPLALLRDPGHRFTLDLTFRGLGSVTSPTHALSSGPADSGLRVRLRDGEVLPDRDCVLNWTPEGRQERTALTVMEQQDAAAGQTYFLALAAPPAARPAGGPGAREAILLVDHSGSMSGAKWEAADWAVKQFLSGLTERDSFALGLFHNTTTWYSAAPVDATPREVEKAIAFLESHKDSGGTELGVALEQALDLKRVRGERARHVLLVTDAEVSDAARTLRLADRESREKDRRRISVLCIDAAPNAFLAAQLAERGGGVSRFLTSAPEEEDVSTALDEVLSDWAEPVLVGLRLEIDRAVVEAAGHDVAPAGVAGRSAIDLGDLPTGRPVWVCGRVPSFDAGPAYRLAAGAAGREVTAARGQPTASSLRALFGARRVAGLEYLMGSGLAGAELADQVRRLGYDPAKVLAGPTAGKVYAENTRKNATAALRGLLVEEALKYGLACAETAFVAVRKEKGKLIDGTVAVANALPAGWSEDFVSVPTMMRMPARAMAPPSPMTHNPHRASMGQFGSGLGLPNLMNAALSLLPVTREATPMAQGRRVVIFIGRPAFSKAEKPPVCSGPDRHPMQPGWKRCPICMQPALVEGPGEAILVDTSTADGAARLSDTGTITELRIAFPAGTPAASSLDAGLAILIYVDDLSAPRARVRLVDLVRQGQKRPLNLARAAGQVVRVVLADPNGAWAGGGLEIEVSLLWA